MVREAFARYCLECAEELKQFIRELAVIPAPSGHEEKRAAYVLEWLNAQGMTGAYIDDALNVVLPYGVNDDNDMYVFMAHTDVVFPDMDNLPFYEDDENFYAPGVSDDTACLAVLLFAVRYYSKMGLLPNGAGILVVANSCEEGLGNLKGCRRIVDTFADRIKGFITIDGSLGKIVTRAVGSHRYEITVRTEGGHSFGAFGNGNAIVEMAKLIDRLYSINVPLKPGTKTTYNVGMIDGGVSVNTIPAQARMLYEYRSDDEECLGAMHDMFEDVIAECKARGLDIQVELVGKRPCGKNGFEREEADFAELFKHSEQSILGVVPQETSGSTDANYPLSQGIPAVCIGGCRGKNAHRRDEYLDIKSLSDGLVCVLSALYIFIDQ